MPAFTKNFWQSAPFIRLLIPFIVGILMVFYIPIPLQIIQLAAIVAMALLLLFSMAILSLKYNWRWLSGITINLLMITLGAALTKYQNLENHADWIGYHQQKNNPILVVIQEPLVQKNKSWKALAKAESVLENGQWNRTKGYLILYFSNNKNANKIHYGTRLIVHQSLQKIGNSGNPGAFNYQQYCAFQQIYFQAYLNDSAYQIIENSNTYFGMSAIFNIRNSVLQILKSAIPGDTEKGVAEALLIGYKDDLNKALVQAYSNTGVVHIIAISGLHLGMIYGLLLLLLKPFGRNTFTKHLRSLIILLVLWGFSFITGGAAAILRSAVTFSFLLISKSLGYKNNSINALAASAFCLLAFNPYLLWDIGFQLSYAAILSILLFQIPINNWVYFKNKLLRHIWQLNAVTLSAQIFTLPLILYYFHQFPNLFLFTNFIVVPLSGIVLYAEILLLFFSPFPLFLKWIGIITSILIHQMNGIIERTNRLPFAVTANLQFSLLQTIVLYLAIFALLGWLVYKNKRYFKMAVCLFLLIVCMRAIDLYQSQQQLKLVVYQIAKQSAMEIIAGKKSQFWMGTQNTALTSNLERTILASHDKHRIAPTLKNQAFALQQQLITTKNTRIQCIDSSFDVKKWPQRIRVDLVIISGNPKLYFYELAAIFDCKNFVADCSNSLWKIRYWKKDAENLHLHLHSVPDQGAFTMDL